jgi:prophage regulatory protein
MVEVVSGLSCSTLYLRISEGLWTRPVNLGGRSVGWPDYEVEVLNAARRAGKSDEEVKWLVRELHAQRGTPGVLDGFDFASAPGTEK